MDEESKQIIASNLAITAAILKLASATKGETTTYDFNREAVVLYHEMLDTLHKEDLRRLDNLEH